MSNSMFSEELRQFILHGNEEVNLEYKESMSWHRRMTKLKLMKAMLAMSNTKDGGVIVIGVKEKSNSYVPEGMKDKHFSSYNYDHLGTCVSNYSDPKVGFKLTCDVISIDGEDKKFCIIQVAEALELPVSCEKTEFCNTDIPSRLRNVCLRKAAIYIRSKAPIGSKEITDSEEWRELLIRCIIKLKNTARVITRKEKPKKVIKLRLGKKSDRKKFEQSLKKNKLI